MCVEKLYALKTRHKTNEIQLKVWAEIFLFKIVKLRIQKLTRASRLLINTHTFQKIKICFFFTKHTLSNVNIQFKIIISIRETFRCNYKNDN